MIFEYHSRKLGETLRFSMPDNGGYVRLEGRQICEGGGFMDNTVISTPNNFERDCRKWARIYVSEQPKE